MEEMNREPKILTLDIETSPIVAYTWGPKWETSIIESIEESKVLSFSAKWLDGKITTKAICDYKGYKKGDLNDYNLMVELRDLLDEADVIVTQNGRKFDIRVINARFIYHNLTPPAPYKHIDTLTEAKRYLKLSSYSLDDMCAYFGIGTKLKHEGFSLWKKCMEGQKTAWKTMKKYNKHDIVLTEQLYLRLRPYMVTHPNFSTYDDRESCPKCGSHHIQHRGYARNTTTVYQRAQCQSCGGWFRTGKNLQKLEHKRANA